MGYPVGTETSHGLHDRRLIPCVRNSSPPYSMQIANVATKLPIQWVPGILSPGLKWSVCEAEHSHPYSVVIMNSSPHTSS